MDNFQIETAQNVSIQQQVAGIGDRILGYLIDLLILGAYWIASIYLLSAFGLDSNTNGSINIYFMLIGIP